MTREFKFRVWNTVLKEYVSPNLLIQKDGLLWLENEDNLYEIEQYTGLKDANGKEIYEGDIVRYRKTLGEIKFDKIKDSDFTYYYLGWIIELEYYSYSPDSLCEYNNVIEVIGNIHENGDLLGVEE